MCWIALSDSNLLRSDLAVPYPQAKPFPVTNNKPMATIAEFEVHCAADADFLQVYDFRVETIEYGAANVRLPFDRKHVRPGETISGPAMMAIADYAIWVAVVGAYGVMAKMAVTTSLNTNFYVGQGLTIRSARPAC
jgi:acyl-coenzyme A thioesterase PaaI-like protein